MNIDPGSDVPLFVQIAEGIEEDIFTGSYAEGDRIPSTNELSADVYKRQPRRPSDVRVERVRSRSARRRRGARAGREGAQVARPPCHDEPLPARREGRRRSAA